MVVRKQSIVLFLFSLVPVFYQFFTLELFELKYVVYIPLVLLLIIGLPLTKLSGMENKRIIAIPVFINFIVIPFATFNIGKFNLGTELFNISLQILLLMVILVVVSVVKDTKSLSSLLKAALWGNSIVLVTTLIVHFNEMLNIRSYMWFLDERLDRATYGFIHPNTAGAFIFLEIILLVLAYLHFNKKIFIVPAVLLLPPLMATGSRTAFITLIIFSLVYIIFRFIGKFQANIKISLISLMTLPFLIFLLGFNWDFLWDSSSGRDDRSLQNIRFLLENNIFWSGIGPVNNTSISIAEPRIITIDNWYLNNTILYGIFGTLSFITAILIIISKYIKHTIFVKNTKVVTWGLAITVSFAIYSFFETFLFTPGVLSSIMFWIFVLSILNVKSDIVDKEINQNKRRKRYRIIW